MSCTVPSTWDSTSKQNRPQMGLFFGDPSSYGERDIYGKWNIILVVSSVKRVQWMPREIREGLWF